MSNMRQAHVNGHPIRGLLLDMDGVLYHGDATLPGALAFLQATAHLPTCFVTNNPIRLPEEVADNLAARGFARPAVEQIVTSGEATAQWLHQQKPGFTFFAIGAPGLHTMLSRYGQADAQHADVVVVGEGPGLDFASISTAIALILQRGATLISTNLDNSVDAVIDGQHRILPGGGALVSPIAAATGVAPITIGKPQPLLYEMALKRLGLKPEETLMVGDRPDTDIEGAARLGIHTALVRTGRFAPGANYPLDLHRPDLDVDTLHHLQTAMGLV